MFRNKRGNASVPFDILSRIGVDLWQWFSGSPPGAVCEPAFRWPALAGGVLSILSIALLGRAMFGPGTGLAAAILAAVHPWHLRYSSEGRCYGILLFLFPLTLWAMHRAWRSPGFGWWLAWGSGVFLCFYTFALMMYPLAALFGISLVVAWYRRAESAMRPWRILAAHLWAGAMTAPAMWPLLVQARAALERPGYRGIQALPGIQLLGDLVGDLWVGAPWTDLDPGNALNPSIPKLWEAHPAWVLVSSGISIFGFGMGLWRGKPKGWTGWCFLAQGIGVGLCWGAVLWSGTLLNAWYLIWLLPFWLILIAGGIESTWSRCWKGKGLGGRGVGLSLCLFCLAMMLVWMPVNRCYLVQSR
ncbi:MAG: glycosyltransferase family 39 protein, partial [Verrucomicrobiae bacterium]|nr:glycosyltransferase family 39 protein [Verrucomicrobiae bacterium]